MLEIAYYRSEHHYRLAYFLIDPLCIHLIGHLSRSSSIHVQFSVRDFLTEKYLCSRVHYGLTLTEIVSIKCFEKLAHKSARSLGSNHLCTTKLRFLFFEISYSSLRLEKRFISGFSGVIPALQSIFNVLLNFKKEPVFSVWRAAISSLILALIIWIK